MLLYIWVPQFSNIYCFLENVFNCLKTCNVKRDKLS